MSLSSPSSSPFSAFTEPIKRVVTHLPNEAINAGKNSANGAVDFIAKLPMNVAKTSWSIVWGIAKYLPIFPGPNRNIAKQLIEIERLRSASESGRLFEGFQRSTRQHIESIL